MQVLSPKLWRSRRSAAVAGLAAVVGAALLAGCGSSSTHSSTSSAAANSSASGSSTAASAPASTNAPAAPASSSGASSGQLTAAGTKLKAGQAAVVEYNNDGGAPTYKLRITVLSIKAGSLADFKAISLSGVPKGDTPTYVQIKMTNLSSSSMNTSSNDPADSVQAYEPNGNGDSNLIITGYFPPCNDVSTPNPFKAGQTFTTCETYFEPGEATQIGYNGNADTVNNPIFWSP
ncbi:MAG: hypothetical protein ACLP01_29080 [Solirubrobacteraceae bacterium]